MSIWVKTDDDIGVMALDNVQLSARITPLEQKVKSLQAYESKNLAINTTYCSTASSTYVRYSKSESFKQEIECTMGGVTMGKNGNYYKLTSVFAGFCSRDNKDIIKITSFKNGGSWTGWSTRGLFIPVKL